VRDCGLDKISVELTLRSLSSGKVNSHTNTVNGNRQNALFSGSGLIQ
jgi:hypothetical protein